MITVIPHICKTNPSFPEGLDPIKEEDQSPGEAALHNELQVQVPHVKIIHYVLSHRYFHKEIKNEILGSDEKGDHSGGSAEGSEWGRFSNDQMTGGRTHHTLERGLGEPSTCHFLNNHEFPHV